MSNTPDDHIIYADDPRFLTERFVAALRRATRDFELKWEFVKGFGSPACCTCEGRQLVLTPNYDDPEHDNFALSSTALDGEDSYMLMGCHCTPTTYSPLRDLYQDIADSICARSPAPMILQMQLFVRKDAEKQILRGIVDASEKLHAGITLQDS